MGSLADIWIRQSTIELASKLCSDTLFHWSWVWRQPCSYIRLWRASRHLTAPRRQEHNRLLISRLASARALEALNEAQRHAVVNLDDRVFVSAGAGSGKTRTIVEKVRHVVRQRVVRPDQVAVITFTNPATDEVRERLRDVDGVAVETIHRLAMRVIERHGFGQPRISPLAEDRHQHRRLLAISRWLDEALTPHYS